MADKNHLKILLTTVAILYPCSARTSADESNQALLSVTRQLPNGDQEQLTGRIHVEAQDGGLMLEDATGCIRTIRAAEIIARQTLDQNFQYLGDDRMAEHLLQTMGNSFAIHRTDHFVICSDASEIYTRYCGQLLESVLRKFQLFFSESTVRIYDPSSRMQVVVFRSTATFQEHARLQHPETDFSDVPGYYSIRDNQMLITAVPGDLDFKRPSDLLRTLKMNRRQIETIVHECVHQLAFNTGLQKRYAEVPLWVSEGLAVYFEGTSGRGSLGWSRPGEASRIHLPTLKKQPIFQQLPLATLISSNEPFQNSDLLASSYSESWALVHFLVTRKRGNFDRLLQGYQQLMPRKLISPAEHLERFVSATDQEIEATQKQLDQHISRLRVPR